MIPLLDLADLHRPIRTQLLAAIEQVLDSGQFIGGPAVERFERELAAHLGVRNAIGVSSGTDALLATLMALDVRPGDEVVVPAITFVATAEVVARLGAVPVFADIDPASYNIDAASVIPKLSPRTVGIIPVHLLGQPCDMDLLSQLARRHGLWLVEDCAQAIGSSWRGRNCGTWGTAGTLSFFPGKNLGALGDAGAIVTQSDDLAAKLRSSRNHGAKSKYDHALVGGNFRLDAIQAAVLSVKLKQLAGWEARRRANAEQYAKLFAGDDRIIVPAETPGGRHVWNQYQLRVREDLRSQMIVALATRAIGHGIYYPVPLHLEECFAELGGRVGDCPVAEQLSREFIALPLCIAEASTRSVAETLSDEWLNPPCPRS